MPRNTSGRAIIAAVLLSASPCVAQMTVQSFGPATWNSDPAIIDAATGMTGATFETFEDYSLDPNLSVSYNAAAPSTDVTFDDTSDPRWDGAVGFSLVLPGTPVTTCMADRLEIVLAQPASRIGFGISLMEIAPGGPSPHPRLIVNGQELIDFIALPNYVNGGSERNVYVVVTAPPGNAISSFGIANTGNCDRVMMDRVGWLPCAIAITSQPASQAVALGSTASFGVTAAGTGALTYHWRRDNVDLSDGGNISGATTATITFSPVSQSDAGSYDCVVTNSCGSATSHVAILGVEACYFQWFERVTSGPSLRYSHAMAYDANRGVTVLFGGYSTAAGVHSGETWEWNGITWASRGNIGPSPRAYHAMAYDAARLVTVLYGGETPGSSVPNGETWEWNGTTWALRASSGPAPRMGHAMVYDTARGVTVLFGGADSGPSPSGETWEWNGTTWALRSNSGPAPRVYHAMAYDATRGVTVLFGGYSYAAGALSGETWEWNGSNWTMRVISGPAPRAGSAMAHDSGRGKTVLFGGSDFDAGYFGDTWEYDGGAWAMRSGGAPSPRTLHAVAYDAGRGVTVLFGGYIAGVNSGETWELGRLAAPTISVQPASGWVCLEGSVTFSVTASGGTLSYQWRREGDNIVGATSATLQIDPVGPGDAGTYDVVVSNGCGSVTSNPATLLVIGTNSADCNNNGILDDCDIASGQGQDCNANGTPDSCELSAATDCNNNAILDTCESAQIALGQPANYPAGDYPSAIIAEDLDNDGTVDLATADYNANTISILKSTPTGLFNPPTTQPTGHAPFGLAAADIDADNKVDLITANESAGTVSVLRNIGGGAFAPHADYPTGPGCFSVAVADLNGDTQPDIATANSAANTVSILINAGGGGFGSTTNIPVAASPQSIAIADLDNDGDRDLVVVNTGPDKISVLKNTGIGLFAAPVLYNTGPDPTSVAIADLDGDSKPDLVVTNLSGNSLSIFHNIGAGTFAPATTIPSGGTFPSHVVAKDVNGDTYPDLIITNSSSNDIAIHVNTGIGTFRPPVVVAVGANPLSVVAAALHGGNVLDLAIANAASDSVSILRNYSLAPPPADCNLDTTPDACQTPDFYLANNLCASFSITQPALLGFTDDGPAANNACAANRNFRLFAGRADAGSNKIWRIRKDCTQAAFGSVLASPSSVLIDTHGYYAGGCTSPNNILVGGRSGADDIISVLNNTTGAVCEQLIDNTIHGIGQMALAPDGKLYIGSIDGDCLMLFSKGVIAPLFCYPGRALRAVALSPDGNVYVAGATDGILRILNPDGVVLNPNFAGCLQNVTSLAFASPGVFHNNLYAACSAPANRVLEIDLATGQTRPFLSNIAVSGIAFDPEGYMHLSIPSENRVLKLGASHPGDMNGDSAVTTQDIPGFIAAALLLPNAPLPVATADMNNDGCVNGKDIQLLVAALSGP